MHANIPRLKDKYLIEVKHEVHSTYDTLMTLARRRVCACRGRCANVNFLGVWLCDSARLVPLSWNIGASTFLRRCAGGCGSS